jgi:hypothetical protein
LVSKHGGRGGARGRADEAERLDVEDACEEAKEGPSAAGAPVQDDEHQAGVGQNMLRASVQVTDMVARDTYHGDVG